jgi:gliding motility-associated-like protein
MHLSKVLAICIGIMILAAPAMGQNITDGLLAYYNFCNCDGADISGNGNHASIVGQPVCDRGKLDRGLWLNQRPVRNACGSNGGEYIKLPAFGPVWANGFTVCAWVKFENPMNYERIIDLGNGSGENGGNPIWFGREGATNNLTLESWIDRGSSNRSLGRLVAQNVVTNGSIEYYCATVHEDTMRIYVNGMMVAEKKGNPILNVPRTSNAIGRSSWCDDDFKGFMDEVRIYNRALSAKEIATLYKVTNVTDFEVKQDCSSGVSFSIPQAGLIDSIRWDYQQPGGGTTFLGSGYNAAGTFAVGTYQVRAIVYKGCLNDTVIKTLQIDNFNNFLGPDTTICEGTGIKLGFAASGRPGYLWQDGSNAQNMTAASSGLYWQKITVNGCSFTDTVNVEVKRNYKPGVVLNAAFDVCAPTNISFTTTITDAGPQPTFEWFINSVATGRTESSFTPATLADGDSVSVAVTAVGSCIPVNAAAFYVVRLPGPPVELQQDTTIIEGTGFTVNATYANAGNTYSWLPISGVSNAGLANPYFSPVITTTYMLQVVSAAGCTATKQFTVTVLPDVVIPNAFSPNGDGINDAWVIKGLQAFTNTAVQVFDRFGRQVFQSKRYTLPWTGMVNNRPLPVGVYYYVINTNSPFFGIRQGALTLIR